MWSVKVMTPTLLTLTQRGLDLSVLCLLCKMGLTVGAPAHGTMRGERRNVSKVFTEFGTGGQRAGRHLGINNLRRGWTPILPSAVPQDWGEAPGRAGTLSPEPVLGGD